MTDEELHRHLVGRQGSRRDLNTPVLVIDRDALDRNIARMAEFAAANGLKLRPHSKTHKSADVARRQIAAGAVGQCCAKLGEAEALADAGIAGLLITSPVISTPAIERLVALNERAEGLMCVADNPHGARAIAAAVAARGARPLTLLIDVDPGIHRTGVASPEAAVELYRTIAAEPMLRYGGVQYYCGSQQHIESFAERAAAMHDRAAYLRSVIAALEAAGGKPPIVSGGGTGTHRIDATLDLFTELQVGSYIFMDDQYRVCALTPEDGDIPYETALLVDTRVISANSPGLVTVDAGIKSLATDAKPPLINAGAAEGTVYFFMGDEQGALVHPAGDLPALDTIVSLNAPHCDPTVNLYDTYHVVSGNTLVDLWPVTARGRSR
ncbi:MULTISPECIES: DSD1 family PLP-dependent enzyme [unclassified Sphingomonas]|uniref:DSD1 family PLP-dependent enzyme n=1 Tax=unclassified Sphingomonas TaxID=196159 RepID=UPI00092BB02C|nr:MULTISPECIES: DSD1 family PLP-dependent enzyme [unclassified Sphingomonas]OJU15927.1 MAG: threonine aldolase [Sphingomonas sp. 66-10]